MGHAGDLLFESAVARTAAGAGGRICGVRDLGHLAVAPAAHGRDRVRCCFSAWSRGGSRYRPRTIVHWRPEVAVMPRAIIDGDRVRLTGVRNFDYRSRNDFTVRYEEREVQLSHLVALDFYVSYFMEGPVGHTFVSFIFDNAPPLSISIETRPEVGEGFAPVASMFKQFELIYVVGSERDLVGVRTNHRAGADLSLSPQHLGRRCAPAAAGLPGADQRARRSAGVLSPADQQLHDQHRALRERRRPGRPDRHPPYPQRPRRQLPLSLGPDRHDAAVRRAAAALPDQRRPRRRPMARPISRSAFAHRCRRSLAETIRHAFCWTVSALSRGLRAC